MYIIPLSIWREIVVNDVPKRARKEKVSNEGEGEGSAVEHQLQWIRGHYADYSRGAGLFGNPNLKGVYWIREHQIGDKEQGTIVPTYKV